jgi:hypothetical protein
MSGADCGVGWVSASTIGRSLRDLCDSAVTNVDPQNTEVPPVGADGQFGIRKSTFGNLRFHPPIQPAAGQRRD